MNTSKGSFILRMLTFSAVCLTTHTYFISLSTVQTTTPICATLPTMNAINEMLQREFSKLLVKKENLCHNYWQM